VKHRTEWKGSKKKKRKERVRGDQGIPEVKRKTGGKSNDWASYRRDQPWYPEEIHRVVLREKTFRRKPSGGSTSHNPQRVLIPNPRNDRKQGEKGTEQRGNRSRRRKNEGF